MVNTELPISTVQFGDTDIPIAQKGTEITDGIVFNSVDGNGFPLTAEFYGDKIVKRAFYNYSRSDGLFKNLKTLTLKDNQCSTGDASFQNCGELETINNIQALTNIAPYAFGDCRKLSGILNFPNVTQIGQNAFENCYAVTKIILPLCQVAYSSTFNNCTSLQYVQLGSVGYGINNFNNSFYNCTQQGLTIEYWIGSNAVQYFDSIVQRIRAQATNSTIIMKAADNLTYGGIAYNAGETILTSEVA